MSKTVKSGNKNNDNSRWKCSICCNRNKQHLSECIKCGQSKPKKKPKDSQISTTSTTNKDDIILRLESRDRIIALIKKAERKKIAKRKIITFLKKKGVSERKIIEAYSTYYIEEGLYEITFNQRAIGFSVIMDKRGKNAIVSSIQIEEYKKFGMKIASKIYEINGQRVDSMKHKDIVQLIKECQQQCPFYIVFKESPKKSGKLEKMNINIDNNEDSNYSSDDYEAHVIYHHKRKLLAKQNKINEEKKNEMVHECDISMSFDIYFKDLRGKQSELRVCKECDIVTIKEKLHKQQGVVMDKLIICGKLLENNKRLCDYNIIEGTQIFVPFLPRGKYLFCAECERELEAKQIALSRQKVIYENKNIFYVIIRTLSSNREEDGLNIFIEIDCNDTVLKLKQKIEEKTGYDMFTQRTMCYSGKRLVDHKNLLSSNIIRGSVIHLPLRLCGGGIKGIIYDKKQETLIVGYTPFNCIPFKIPSFHISCKSDKINGNDMVGIVLYKYGDLLEWEINKIHCCSGYIILKLTENIINVESKIGIVHGKCYKFIFDEEINDKVIGAGFSFKNGEWKFNSYSLNTGNKYHDEKKSMHKIEQQCILYIIQKWQQNGIQTVKSSDIAKEYDGCCSQHGFY